MSKMKDVGMPIVTCLLGIIGGYLVNGSLNRQAEERLIAREKRLEARTEWEESKAFYQQVEVHLDGSRAAFGNQIAARNRLIMLLQARTGTLPDLEYEPLFRQKYTQFSDEEKHLCDFMRGITIESLSRHNEAVLALLEEHPERRSELPSFPALHEHLDLWLSKYRAVEEQQGWCLVYVGVEEGKPFPAPIGQEVQSMLEQLIKQGPPESRN